MDGSFPPATVSEQMMSSCFGLQPIVWWASVRHAAREGWWQKQTDTSYSFWLFAKSFASFIEESLNMGVHDHRECDGKQAAINHFLGSYFPGV